MPLLSQVMDDLYSKSGDELTYELLKKAVIRDHTILMDMYTMALKAF